MSVGEGICSTKGMLLERIMEGTRPRGRVGRGSGLSFEERILSAVQLKCLLEDLGSR